jgi:hypothetical protein
VTLTQEEFTVSIEGDAKGVVVDKTLVLDRGERGDDPYWSGLVGGATIQLQTLSRAGCILVLTPSPGLGAGP